MAKVIYELQHYCGWGPYCSYYFETLAGAKKALKEQLKEVRKDESYIKKTIKKEEVFNFDVDAKKRNHQPVELERWHWQMMRESNNENGHEFWEEDELLSINEITLKP